MMHAVLRNYWSEGVIMNRRPHLTLMKNGNDEFALKAEPAAFISQAAPAKRNFWITQRRQ
jgi:hypothetical protein